MHLHMRGDRNTDRHSYHMVGMQRNRNRKIGIVMKLGRGVGIVKGMETRIRVRIGLAYAWALDKE